MKIDHLILFEDHEWRRLWPLNSLQPSCALYWGATPVWQKLRQAISPRNFLAIALDGKRDEIVRAFNIRNNLPERTSELSIQGNVLWWNTAVLPPSGFLEKLEDRNEPTKLISEEGDCVGLLHEAGALDFDRSLQILSRGTATTPIAEMDLNTARIGSLWELISGLEARLRRDLEERARSLQSLTSHPGVHILGEHFYSAPDVQIAPGVVIDSRDGPVVLEEKVSVEALTHLQGPALIGAGTELLGGRIVNTVMGPQCRVGGEVDTVVLQGYANKRHQGFLGHAVAGEWVNLGALTSNSDLKNNYGPVRVWVDGKQEDSGQQKVGCFLGDHVKTGIGTMITTGAVIGPGSNLFGGGRFSPKYLPGWSWWDGESVVPHDWEKFMATARIALGRRQKELRPDMEAAMRQGWNLGPTSKKT